MNIFTFHIQVLNFSQLNLAFLYNMLHDRRLQIIENNLVNVVFFNVLYANDFTKLFSRVRLHHYNLHILITEFKIP